MNIAIMTDLYFPMTGGTEVSINNQKNALEAAGHHVTIFTVQHRDTPVPDDVVIIPSMHFTTGQQDTVRISRPFIMPFVVDEVAKRHIDIIHVQTDFAVGVAGMYAARKLHLPLVYTFHTLIWKQIQTRTRSEKIAVHILEKPMQWRLEPRKDFTLARIPGEPLYAYKARRHVCLLASRANIVISPSAHMAHRFREWIPSQHIVTSPNFTTTQPRNMPLPKIPTFLWMGRMMPEKRILDFCAAIDLMPRYTSRPFRVIVVGNGHHLDAVKIWAADKEFVTVTGSVTHAETDKYIDASSALVMTSQGFDNQPMVIAESIVAGRGIISVDPDLLLDIDPEAGVYPVDSSPEGLAEQLAGLVENPRRIMQMSASATHCASTFSAGAGYARLMAAYKEAIRTSR